MKEICCRGVSISSETFDVVATKLQSELADAINLNKQVNDYELIVYKFMFIDELGIPLLQDLEIKICEDSFIIHVIPNDLDFDLLKKLDNAFDKFKITFMPNKYNVVKLKFTLCDYMYNEEEKKQLMDDLVEMETFKVDIGDEGKILQDDLKKYFLNDKGNKDDLIFRLEMYFYAFKLFCRKDITIDKNQFSVYLNDSILDYHLINLVKKDLTDFELEIEAVKINNEVFLNLNFILHF